MSQTTGRVQLPSKKRDETITLSQFNFAANLAPTETLLTAVCVCNVYSGVDPLPANVLSGAASISGTTALQNVTLGIQGVIYALVMRVTTSLGQALELSGFLAVTTELP